MKTLYLHIGTHKTGSSVIQKFLYNNRDDLLKKGFYYPTEGSYFYKNESSQSLLAHSLINRRPKYIPTQTVFEKDICIRDIINDVQVSKASNVIISSEHFSKGYSYQNLLELKELFAPIFSEIKIIVYLRRQDFYIESSYNQCIKSALIDESFEEYYEKEGSRDYFEFIEILATVFGKTNLKIRPYERKQLYKLDIVSDFLNILGIEIFNQNLEMHNESIPIEMAEVMRLISKNLKTRNEKLLFNNFLRSAPIKFDKTKYTLLRPELRKKILARHREGNASIARQYLGRDDGVMFLDTEIVDLPVYPGLSMDRLSEIYSIIWSIQVKTYFNLRAKIRQDNYII